MRRVPWTFVGHGCWRPSRRFSRRAVRLDRYYERCYRLAGGAHVPPPYVRRYVWGVRYERLGGYVVRPWLGCNCRPCTLERAAHGHH